MSARYHTLRRERVALILATFEAGMVAGVRLIARIEADRATIAKKGAVTFQVSLLGDFDISCFGEGIFINVVSLTGRQTVASMFAALAALPDAPKTRKASR